ncbi:NUDIX hydrolase [Kocuria sp. HSID16901]|uniref:NUDIX hydrolase n=1 Tax=Kocuria sp. HSID16901 TaxID=2419505 RepID=UPI00065FBD02|nr:NUDIX domain-containing protein [Kocuria sp. HSID16901]RUQ23483.1 NUDIX domain-containing protein [Kocuria sp. HSID16901]
MPHLTVAAVVLADAEGMVLTVRKRDTRFFMFPGGKLEPGEEPREAAVREVGEELGLQVSAEDLDFLGTWDTTAANESGFGLTGYVYRWPESAVALRQRLVHPQAEIEELRWIVPRDGLGMDDLAPLTRDCVFPELISRGE